MSPDDDEQYARQKFGTQKGISSDEFFGRNNYDPNAQTEAKERLHGFEGATSISSNAYFGRPEDDIPQADEYGNYGDLEGAARDFVRKFGITAGDDLENLSNMVGEGAQKLKGELGCTKLSHDKGVNNIADTVNFPRCCAELFKWLIRVLEPFYDMRFASKFCLTSVGLPIFKAEGALSVTRFLRYIITNSTLLD